MKWAQTSTTRSSRAMPRRRAHSPWRGPQHWLLDLYAIARRRLARAGVERVFGGTLCTYSDARFFLLSPRSHGRPDGRDRMARMSRA
jgi:copper oxidase (laccase) domain-containing protein